MEKCQQKALLSKKNISAKLQFANEHVGQDHIYWYNVVCRDESKLRAAQPQQQQSFWPRC